MNKYKLIFTLTDPETSEIVYERQVVLPGLNDDSRDNSQSVEKKINIDVSTGKEYTVTLKNNNGASETRQWYIPEEGTRHVSLSSSISPSEEINFVNRVV